MTENEFKRAIWKSKDYFKTKYGYLNNQEFFQAKEENSGTSDDFYISTEAIKDWAYQMSQYYTPFNNDHALLIKDLLERRGEQYSNGTLYSSSRLIAEMFKGNDNRKKLLKHLNLSDYCFEGFKWYLEYRLPIFDNHEQHPAQLDLVAINDNAKIFVGIESKMKEIYSNHHNDFSKSYEPLLNDLNSNNIFNIIRGSKEYPLRLTLNDCSVPEYCNFYYKQQICHLLGMRRFISEHKDYRCLFMNFVFDIRDIPGYEDENNINDYLNNEQIIMERLKPLFTDSGITYCGRMTQIDFI